MFLSKEEEQDYDIYLAEGDLDSALSDLEEYLESFRSGGYVVYGNLQNEVDDLRRSIPSLISALREWIEFLEFVRDFPVDLEELGSEDIAFGEWQSDAHSTYLADLDGVRREAGFIFDDYWSDASVYCDGLIPTVEEVAEAVRALMQALTAKIDYLRD